MSLPATYKDNLSNPSQDSNIGIKLSKPGYPADKTTGSNLIFDSDWPTLSVAFEKTIVNNSSATLDHNLGFAPLTFFWVLQNDPRGVNNIVVGKGVANVNTTQVLNLPTGYTINVKCFQLNLAVDIDYILAPGDTFSYPYDPNFGIKVVKPLKDINSTDLRDFSLHSRCQSPLVLAVKTETTQNPANPGVVQYTSKQESASWVYGFIKKSDNSYASVQMYTQSYPRLFTDGFTSYLQYISPDIGATIVVLRDPMFATTQTTVQY